MTNPHDDPGGPCQSIRILMAEADRNEHLLMTMAAEDCVHPVLLDFVRDGQELLRSITNPRYTLPDLLVIDLRLSGVDAANVLIALGLHERLRTLPVIVMADAPDADDEALCYALGAFHVERKPDTFCDMVRFLDRLTGVDPDEPIRRFSLANFIASAEQHPFTDLAGSDG